MGLIFTPDNAELVMEEVKTKTRRPFQPGDEYSAELNPKHPHRRDWCPITEVYRGPKKRLLWRVGNIYAVQPGRGKNGIGYVKVLKIELQMLGAITARDAKAEGFYSKQAFFNAWWKLYPHKDRNLSQMVWVLTFRRVRSS